MSAFLFEKALKEKGFDKAFSLVYSGNDGGKFFENLDSVLGIKENNFHKTILKLIEK